MDQAGPTSQGMGRLLLTRAILLGGGQRCGGRGRVGNDGGAFQGRDGGGVLWYVHKRDDNGNDWYDDKAIRERFRFSWVALRRWEENEVKLELETEQQLLQRRKEKMMEQMLSQTAATVEQIRFLSEGRGLG